MDDKLVKIVKDLKENIMFRLSLGSKELFHSNFLEYLFDINPKLFIDMINSFELKGIHLSEDIDYKIEREKKDFDICIYHMEGNKEIYDLIIENKVKSIPYKTQLEDYVNKVKKNNKTSDNCSFILLTLSKDFPDKDDKEIIEKYWRIITYNNLKEQINAYYLDNVELSLKIKEYIRDYYNFISLLDQLKDILIPDKTDYLFNENDKKYLEKIRLHDLYIKLRCSWFAITLKNLLDQEGIRTKVINKYEEREYGYVNINVTINQGNGQIAAWICDSPDIVDNKKNTNMFEIVIQGDEYRHGINLDKILVIPRNAKKYDKLNILYNTLSTLSNSRPYEFLNFEKEYNIGDNILTQPDKIKNFKGTKIKKAGLFNSYNDTYLYRFKNINNINNTNINQLLEWMIKDIKLIYNNIPKFE